MPRLATTKTKRSLGTPGEKSSCKEEHTSPVGNCIAVTIGSGGRPRLTYGRDNRLGCPRPRISGRNEQLGAFGSAPHRRARGRPSRGCLETLLFLARLDGASANGHSCSARWGRGRPSRSSLPTLPFPHV